MFKFAGLIIDQFDDPDGKIVNIRKHVPLGILKTASADEKHYYALKIIANKNVYNKFPLDTPYDAYVSALYFEKTASDLPASIVPQVAARIKKALEAHNIDTTQFKKLALSGEYSPEPVVLITKLAKDELTLRDKIALIKEARKLSYRAKKNLPDSAFALVVNEGGRKIRKYPLHDRPHVRNAIVRFSQHYDKLPPKYRSTVARKIKQRAKELGIEISPDNVINKYASDQVAPYVYEALETRYEITKSPAYTKLASMLGYMKPQTVAETIEILDKNTGFDKYWDAYGDPYEIVFGNYKTAADRFNDIVSNVHGVKIPDRTKKYLQKLYGDKIVEILEKDPQAIQDLIPQLPGVDNT